MNALIVEDIISTCDLIKNRIQSLSKSIKTIDQAHDLETAYNKISKNDLDIVFLDIQMPNGTTFDILKRLSDENKIDFEIIFITGQKESEYLINAIKFSAIDFLYKPLDDEALIQAIEKAENKITNRKNAKRVELLLEYVDKVDSNHTNRVAFQLSKGLIKFFNVDQITHLMADGVVTKVFLADGAEYRATKNLGYYKSFLISQFNFCSISHGTLINVDLVDGYMHKEQIVSMKNGFKLKASRRGGKEFKDRMEDSLLDGGSFFTRLKNLIK